jgi:hypothetical protein
MLFILETITIKKFLYFLITGMLVVFASVIFLALNFNFNLNAIVLMVLIVGVIVLLFFMAHSFAKKKLEIRINDDNIHLGNEEIKYTEIEGFFEDPNLTMSGFSIKLKSGRCIQITGLYRGSARINFDNFIGEFVRKMSTTGTIKPLSYLEVHPNQAISANRFVWFIVIFNVAAVIAMIVIGKFLPKIFLVNIFAYGMKPYLSRKKKTE